MARVQIDDGQAYTNFYEKWRPKFAAIMARKGFNPNSPEFDDVLQDLCADFFEGDYLRIYDPSKASMNTFVYAFVLPRLMGKRDKLSLQAQREVPFSAVEGNDGEEIDLEDLVGEDDLNLVDIDVQDLLDRTEKALEGMVVHRKYSLAEIFREVLRHVRKYGYVDRKEMARKMHVSESTISLLIGHLRNAVPMQELREALM